MIRHSTRSGAGWLKPARATAAGIAVQGTKLGRACPRESCQAPIGWACRVKRNMGDGVFTWEALKRMHKER